MINTTIQTIHYDGWYIFRNMTYCSQPAFDMLKNKANFDIHTIKPHQLGSGHSKWCIENLLNPEYCDPKVYSDSFDYFIQHKQLY